jgi:hypothetical protein
MIDTADDWLTPWMAGTEGIAELTPAENATAIEAKLTELRTVITAGTLKH